MVVAVTGAAGQLGQSLQFIAKNYPEITFHFLGLEDLDITEINDVDRVLTHIKPRYCINTAAYTAVDKAESDIDLATRINVDGSKNLAEICKKLDIVLLHISTDFIFDGNASKPYTEKDIPNPTGVYGQTKLDGEKAIQEIWEKYFIIRTSWVYSQFGHNFMKTMLRLASERDTISVVNDQIGTPTNAVDLAEVLLEIICHSEHSRGTTDNFGVYNFSNEGQCSWFDFAKKTFEINDININLLPIPTSSFPTPAKRPAYSVLDKSKIKKAFNLSIKSWETSLEKIK